MGMYDPRMDFGFVTQSRKPIRFLAAGLVMLVIIAALYFLALGFSGANPLEMRFEKNPVKSGEAVKIFVRVSNNSETDAENVTITLKAVEQTEFDVFSLNEKFAGSIPRISKGTSREVTFIANPIGKTIPGTYKLVAMARLNNVDYEKEAVLTVQE